MGPGDETRFTARPGEETGEEGIGDDGGNGDLNTFVDGSWVRMD